MELVKINPQEFGLTDDTAKNIQMQFEPMLAKMVSLENEFNEVINLPIENPNTCKRAKELRLKYVKVRTATAEIHKAQKAFYLNGGRFVDGWKNAQVFASQSKEDVLDQIERYYENLEKERLEKIHNERVNQIRQYIDDTTSINFGQMPEDVWQAYLSAKVQAHNDRIEAEKAAEVKRLAAEIAERQEREAQRLENDRLKKEAEIREAQIKAERDKAESEAQKMQAELKAEREKAEAALKAEREMREKAEREKLEAELKERKEQEQKAVEAKRLANAPKKERLLKWLNTLEMPEIEINDPLSESIKSKFAGFKAWAVLEVEKM